MLSLYPLLRCCACAPSVCVCFPFLFLVFCLPRPSCPTLSFSLSLLAAIYFVVVFNQHLPSLPHCSPRQFEQHSSDSWIRDIKKKKKQVTSFPLFKTACTCHLVDEPKSNVSRTKMARAEEFFFLCLFCICSRQIMWTLPCDHNTTYWIIGVSRLQLKQNARLHFITPHSKQKGAHMSVQQQRSTHDGQGLVAWEQMPCVQKVLFVSCKFFQ